MQRPRWNSSVAPSDRVARRGRSSSSLSPGPSGSRSGVNNHAAVAPVDAPSIPIPVQSPPHWTRTITSHTAEHKAFREMKEQYVKLSIDLQAREEKLDRTMRELKDTKDELQAAKQREQINTMHMDRLRLETSKATEEAQAKTAALRKLENRLAASKEGASMLSKAHVQSLQQTVISLRARATLDSARIHELEGKLAESHARETLLKDALRVRATQLVERTYEERIQEDQVREFVEKEKNRVEKRMDQEERKQQHRHVHEMSYLNADSTFEDPEQPRLVPPSPHSSSPATGPSSHHVTPDRQQQQQQPQLNDPDNEDNDHIHEIFSPDPSPLPSPVHAMPQQSNSRRDRGCVTQRGRSVHPRPQHDASPISIAPIPSVPSGAAQTATISQLLQRIAELERSIAKAIKQAQIAKSSANEPLALAQAELHELHRQTQDQSVVLELREKEIAQLGLELSKAQRLLGAAEKNQTHLYSLNGAQRAQIEKLKEEQTVLLQHVEELRSHIALARQERDQHRSSRVALQQQLHELSEWNKDLLRQTHQAVQALEDERNKRRDESLTLKQVESEYRELIEEKDQELHEAHSSYQVWLAKEQERVERMEAEAIEREHAWEIIQAQEREKDQELRKVEQQLAEFLTKQQRAEQEQSQHPQSTDPSAATEQKQPSSSTHTPSLISHANAAAAEAHAASSAQSSAATQPAETNNQSAPLKSSSQQSTPVKPAAAAFNDSTPAPIVAAAFPVSTHPPLKPVPASLSQPLVIPPFIPTISGEVDPKGVSPHGDLGEEGAKQIRPTDTKRIRTQQRPKPQHRNNEEYDTEPSIRLSPRVQQPSNIGRSRSRGDQSKPVDASMTSSVFSTDEPDGGDANWNFGRDPPRKLRQRRSTSPPTKQRGSDRDRLDGSSPYHAHRSISPHRARRCTVRNPCGRCNSCRTSSKRMRNVSRSRSQSRPSGREDASSPSPSAASDSSILLDRHRHVRSTSPHLARTLRKENFILAPTSRQISPRVSSQRRERNRSQSPHRGTRRHRSTSKSRYRSSHIRSHRSDTRSHSATPPLQDESPHGGGGRGKDEPSPYSAPPSHPSTAQQQRYFPLGTSAMEFVQHVVANPNTQDRVFLLRRSERSHKFDLVVGELSLDTREYWGMDADGVTHVVDGREKSYTDLIDWARQAKKAIDARVVPNQYHTQRRQPTQHVSTSSPRPSPRTSAPRSSPLTVHPPSPPQEDARIATPIVVSPRRASQNTQATVGSSIAPSPRGEVRSSPQSSPRAQKQPALTSPRNISASVTSPRAATVPVVSPRAVTVPGASPRSVAPSAPVTAFTVASTSMSPRVLASTAAQASSLASSSPGSSNLTASLDESESRSQIPLSTSSSLSSTGRSSNVHEKSSNLRSPNSNSFRVTLTTQHSTSIQDSDAYNVTPSSSSSSHRHRNPDLLTSPDTDDDFDPLGKGRVGGRGTRIIAGSSRDQTISRSPRRGASIVESSVGDSTLTSISGGRGTDSLDTGDSFASDDSLSLSSALSTPSLQGRSDKEILGRSRSPRGGPPPVLTSPSGTVREQQRPHTSAPMAVNQYGDASSISDLSSSEESDLPQPPMELFNDSTSEEEKHSKVGPRRKETATVPIPSVRAWREPVESPIASAVPPRSSSIGVAPTAASLKVPVATATTKEMNLQQMSKRFAPFLSQAETKPAQTLVGGQRVSRLLPQPGQYQRHSQPRENSPRSKLRAAAAELRAARQSK